MEREIAKELDLSRGAVREAIQVLIGQRLLEREKQRSARIRQLSGSDLLAVIEILEMVGSLAARLASENIKRRDNAKRLRKAADDLIRAVEAGDRAEIRRQSQNHWMLVIEIGKNPYLVNVSESLQIELYDDHIFELVLGHPKKYREWLAQISDAICSGEPAEAEEAYRRFQGWLYELVQDHLEGRDNLAAGVSESPHLRRVSLSSSKS